MELRVPAEQLNQREGILWDQPKEKVMKQIRTSLRNFLRNVTDIQRQQQQKMRQMFDMKQSRDMIVAAVVTVTAVIKLTQFTTFI